MLLFGLVQVVFSQIPDFHEMAWLSVLASVMSFSYSSIGFALGLAKVIGISLRVCSLHRSLHNAALTKTKHFWFTGNGRMKGGIGGISMASAPQKVWRISQALGDIAFAYPYSIVLFDIEVKIASLDSSFIFPQ